MHLELISAYVSEYLKRIQKDIPSPSRKSLSLSPVPPFSSPPSLPSARSSRRGGRSVRRNAALSSKAHRHSSPLVHRAKRRISVFLPSSLPASSYILHLLLPLSLAIPPIHLLEKWTSRENQMAEFAWREKAAFASPRLSTGRRLMALLGEVWLLFAEEVVKVRAILNSRRIPDLKSNN